MGWTSPVNIKLKEANLTDSPLPEIITTDQESWIGSLLTWSLLLSSVPLFVGWILIAAATNVAFLYSGRIFWGVAVGMIFTVSPMYCAEIATIADVFKGGNFKAFYISCALVFFQQFCGINAVLFYMTNIFEAAGSDLDSSIATIIIGCVQALLGMYFLLDELDSPAVDSIGFLPILSLVVFIVTYCVGLGPLPWAVMGELMPIEALGMYVAFWIFGVCCVGAFFFTLFLVPETKGKSFAEIQDMLAG
ncbi:hypothetical protein MSG28_014085, partial [Choristoneura fumiferana]